MASLIAGVLRERAPGERRVALIPESVTRLKSAGVDVVVEAGAGAAAWFTDADYTAAGAEVVGAEELFRRADVVLCVGPPEAEEAAPLREGQTLIGLLDPLQHPALVGELAGRGVTVVSLDLLPRTLSRAQSMDALTSQANVAGYKAVLLAADSYDRYFPMLTTAAGTSKPAALLVLGAGVAGLQAIATARRLGAIVSGYDVRPAAQGEIESLGARYLKMEGIGTAAGEGGYARQLTEDETQALLRALEDHIARSDVVITTARVPGRRPPLLVTAAALERMRPGSVVVDMAASELGGNVELSEPDKTTVLDNGVTLIGAANLPSVMATAASTAYARNISALLTHLLRDGQLHIDTDDEIQAGVVVAHGGSVVNPAVGGVK
ncbi:NAD(P) transhydrogenase subunit alpha [Streptomyces sp. RB5]|uniref:proton-translocating NAD(P)(+) transhydrogenase n=1 Tax=Streptomyces smaragdinus TaxID=2585196 RepID=A0A7K0C9J5_9ACTN|nr:Re/Si-specific NAD(P)(+) transhydrogenase subunit alpha [Streptomyces smaragdinus]MQY10119.1 NAD(P) transhydrogenase subunit alpha [Streptomyces smaragdinus]